jgi:hypothetical protein
MDLNEYNNLSSPPTETAYSLSSPTSVTDSDPEPYSMPPRRGAAAPARRLRKRTAAEAVDFTDDAENEASAAGPSIKRRNTGAGNRRTQGSSSQPQGEPIVIDDLDEEDDGEAEKLKETLQKQREEQVKAQGGKPEDAEPPKLNKLQCVICMDSFTDMTATSCGTFNNFIFCWLEC